MKNIILCSSNPILVKSLYGILRDEGYEVETVEHPAFAVQRVMSSRRYDFIIIDSEPFGLSTEDAVEIIKNIAPEMPVLYVGGPTERKMTETVGSPLDLEEFKRRIHSIAF